MSPSRLKHFFDKVVLINLPGRTDRLAQIKQAMDGGAWPFRRPEIFPAIDGSAVTMPKKWKLGAGAWGCLCSHREVLAQAMREGVERLLILEDDACFTESFSTLAKKFLQNVPDDWDGLMLGGQHMNPRLKPSLIKPGVCQVFDCERTHCYAVRGDYLRKLHQRLCGGGKFNALAFNDQIMGRDPQLQRAHKIYAPQLFLVGQERSFSSIVGIAFPRRFWNPPGAELPLINFHGSRAVITVLRQFGWFTGYTHNDGNGIECKLWTLFRSTRHDLPKRRERLREWIKILQWEVAADPGFIATIWHPEASPELVNAASPWRVYEVTADSVGAAMQQIPRRLRQAGMGGNGGNA
ncbi:MAG TPA: glycosyltransferase family 25 protein [Opitutales bacterium]|nr:glycosyltransferase family 25 protein [Opitutales bacterium]